jgi:hypothetical protein
MLFVTTGLLLTNPRTDSIHQNKCSSEGNPGPFVEDHILNCNDDGTPPGDLGSHIFGSITGGTYYVMVDGCKLLGCLLGV